jgi:uncharacterized protein YkwD
MVSPVRALNRRRLASLLLVAVVGAAIVAPGAAVATTTTIEPANLTALESAMVSALNADRTARGLVAVRVDARLMAIARARSEDMIAKNYFSHTQPDGRNAFDMLREQSIAWYGAGEIIAWNNYPLESTVSAANRGWMNSPGHKAIIISTNYNYVGVGLAVDAASGKKMWTAVYLKGPDRTAARTTVYTPRIVSSPTPTSRRVKFVWTGYDPRLQVLTSGLRSYTIQRRIDGGAWATSVASTTQNYKYFNLALGHRYELRFSARDNAGNTGAWVTKVVDLR